LIFKEKNPQVLPCALFNVVLSASVVFEVQVNVLKVTGLNSTRLTEKIGEKIVFFTYLENTVQFLYCNDNIHSLKSKASQYLFKLSNSNISQKQIKSFNSMSKANCNSPHYWVCYQTVPCL
jgi:hypothetical protein